MKRKGFTLVELLVVIAIIALLMGILMPALAKVRQIAFRMICGTNCAAIGKAMLVYSNEQNDSYPIAGEPIGGNDGSPRWSTRPYISDFHAENREDAFVDPTISASFYCLIKYTDCTTKMFICKGDVGARPFSMDQANIPAARNVILQDLWDFGNGQGTVFAPPSTFCSYSYHMPYKHRDGTASTALNANSDPGSPIVSDRNPYLDGNATDRIENPEDYGYEPDPGATPMKYNSECHEVEGQNVLYNDGHVDFEARSNVGLGKDNIWSCWGPSTSRPPMEERQWSESPNIVPEADGDHYGTSRQDAYLVSNSTL